MVEPSKQLEVEISGGYVYYPKKKLGSGSFGVVYEGFNKKDPKTTVAIKCLSRPNDNLTRREIDILKSIKGEHIVEFLDSTLVNVSVFIITSFCNGGTLRNLLVKEKTLPEKTLPEKTLPEKKTLSEVDALDYLMQIALAFEEIRDCLETRNEENDGETWLMHRDIKPDNILFHNGKLKICDFGVARIVSTKLTPEKSTISQKFTITGTGDYMSPQLMSNKKYTSKTDVWSAGIVFYEMLFGDIPWNDPDVALSIQIEKNPTPVFFEEFKVSEESKDLILRMLAIEEADRIDWRGILVHPAFYLLNMAKWEEKLED